MITCHNVKELIEKYLDGDITDDQQDALQKHAGTCPSCRAEFQCNQLLAQTVQEALTSRRSPEQAKSSILSALAVDTDSAPPPVADKAPRFTPARAVLAASFMLAAGLSLGFLAGRGDLFHTNKTPAKRQVPMQIAKIEGTILVKHRNSQVWHSASAGDPVYLGDAFHSAAKSNFVLQFEDNSTIEVRSNSMLALTMYNGETIFFLEHGACRASLESPHPPFFISTPHGRAEALGTEFTITVE